MRTFISSMILLLATASALQGQDGLRSYPLPRVGAHIDAGETEYFLLFPELARFSRGSWEHIFPGAQWLPEGRYIPAEFAVFQTVEDSVLLRSTATEDGETHSIVISKNAALVLGVYLERYEEIRATMKPFEIKYRSVMPDSLQDAAEELFDTDILPKYWPHWSSAGPRTTIAVRTIDGRFHRGVLLGVTQRRLIVWSGGVGFAEHEIDSALHVIPFERIDSLSVPGEEHATGTALGLMGSVMAWGHLLFGSHYDQSEGDASMLGPLTFPLALATGLLGSVIPVTRDYQMMWDSTGSERLGRSPLFGAMATRPGLAPEIRGRIGLGMDEGVYRWEHERVPFTQVASYMRQQKRSYVALGVEQLWLSAPGILGVKFGASVGYEHSLYDPVGGLAGISAGVQLSGGSEYGAARVLALVRFGPFRFSYGLRAMVLPEHLNTSSPWPHGNNRDITHTMYYNHAETAGHYLYTDWGAELIVWHAVLSLHFISQQSPSVLVHTTSRAPYGNTPEYESYESGIRIDAMVLAIQFRL